MKNIAKALIFLTAFVLCLTTCETPTDKESTNAGTLFVYAGTASSLEIANDSRGYTFPDTFLNESNEVTITLKNTGDGIIQLTGRPYIILDGATALFSVSVPPEASTISPGASVSFKIRFTPLNVAESYVYVSIPNNSKNEPDFSFTVYGKGIPPKPQISIQQNNTTINLYGEYNFDSILAGKTSDIIFTIKNPGTANLNIIPVNGNRINIEDNITGQFTLIQQPSTLVTPGNTTIFIIRFSPTEDGVVSTATVHIKTDSQNDGDFYFFIKGTGRDYYLIGETGPAGGIIFYDAGTVVNGWRYLEAALIDFSAPWGPTGFPATQLSIGSGKNNTQIIITWQNELMLEEPWLSGWKGRTTAIQLCAVLDFGGFTDWFVPSMDELDLMYRNLRLNGLGGFSNDLYWSSSGSGYSVHTQKFSDGLQNFDHCTATNKVRAVRSF
jgi:hypothetical protein